MSGMTDAQALAAKQAFRCRLMPAIAKILVRRFWVSLVFNGLAAVAPSNRDDPLPLIE